MPDVQFAVLALSGKSGGWLSTRPPALRLHSFVHGRATKRKHGGQGVRVTEPAANHRPGRILKWPSCRDIPAGMPSGTTKSRLTKPCGAEIYADQAMRSTP